MSTLSQHFWLQMPVLVADIQYRAADRSFRYSAGLSSILIGTSLVAILYNYIHAAVIKATSATTTTVIGQIKVVGLVIFSAALLGKRPLLLLPP